MTALRSCFASLLMFLLMVMLLPRAAGAGAPGTHLQDAVKLTGVSCTITISPRDHQLCVGSTDSVTATVSCGAGEVQIRTPEWFLDASPIGFGNGIRFSAGEGSHTLSVSCGSCTDQILVTVLPTTSCLFPDLVAEFADPASEGTTGIFQQVNVTAVTPSNFEEVKFLMRPVTLTGTLADGQLGGSYILSQTGTNLQVFRADGTELVLPDTLHQPILPLEMLVNATGIGASTLIATYDSETLAGSSDSIRVRVGQFPGLAGKSLAMYPSFEFMRSINDSSQVRTAIDPTRHAERIGLPYRIYVVNHRTPAGWAANNTLTDVTGGFDTATVTAGTIAANIRTVWSSGLDGGTAGTVGKPYDVVYDFGNDGTLDPGDLVDGLDYGEAGFYLVRNLTLAGNHPVIQTLYSGGPLLGQKLYFPSDIGSMGQLPLVVIGHGNTHSYTWYDYLGVHLASYGYVVMSHQNNTGPGVEAASTTTLTNTDYLLSNLGSIVGGLLNGHVDTHKITWVGHSRGGEGVLFAYDRIFEGYYTPVNYTPEDIILIRSMAPTMFYNPVWEPGPDPHDRNFDLIWGSADDDVSGDPSSPVTQAQPLLEHAGGTFIWVQIQGAGHGDLHGGPGGTGVGPDLIGKEAVNNISKVFLLAELEWFTRGNPAAKDYFTHLWDDFRSSGLITPASSPPGIVAVNYKDAAATGTVIIDDYESQPAAGISSSGGLVTFNVSNLTEGRLDGNTDFTWSADDPFNGCENTEGDLSVPPQSGVVFDWTVGEQKFYEEGIVAGQRDFTTKAFLSLRAAQGTRHPETVALNGPLYFTVELQDAAGHTSAIPTRAYGGINRNYQRSGEGVGVGWFNEWSTVRIRLADFENNNSQIDLTHIVGVRLRFGSASGSARGRICLDQIELARE